MGDLFRLRDMENWEKTFIKEFNKRCGKICKHSVIYDVYCK